MSENKQFESRQIVRVEGNKKLLELQDHMEKNEKATTLKPLSCNSKQRLVLVDYSSNGDNNISVYFNLDKKCLFTLNEMAVTRKDFKKEETRIAGNPDENGLCSTKKLTVTRQAVDGQGKAKAYPFYVCIEEGRGVKAQSQTGGFYLKSGTFVCEKKAFVNLAQLDFEYLLSEGIRYWNCTEDLFRTELMVSKAMGTSLNTYYSAEKKMLESVIGSAISSAKEEIIKSINELPM